MLVVRWSNHHAKTIFFFCIEHFKVRYIVKQSNSQKQKRKYYENENYLFCWLFNWCYLKDTWFQNPKRNIKWYPFDNFSANVHFVLRSQNKYSEDNVLTKFQDNTFTDDHKSHRTLDARHSIPSGIEKGFDIEKN